MKSDKGATQVGKWDFPGVGYECLIVGSTPDIIEHSFSDNGVWPHDSNWVFKNRHRFVTAQLAIKYEDKSEEKKRQNLEKFNKMCARARLKYDQSEFAPLKLCHDFPLCENILWIGCCLCPKKWKHPK